MNRREAIIAMANGETVKAFGTHYYMLPDGMIFYFSNFEDNHIQRTLGLPCREDYEIYKPKVKRKIEVWVNVYKDYCSYYNHEAVAKEIAKENCLVVAHKLEGEVEVDQ